jgi:hypothetical protein
VETNSLQSHERPVKFCPLIKKLKFKKSEKAKSKRLIKMQIAWQIINDYWMRELDYQLKVGYLLLAITNSFELI